MSLTCRPGDPAPPPSQEPLVVHRTATRPPQEAPPPAPRQGLLRGIAPRVLGLWLLLAVVVAVCVLSIAVGTRPIGLGTVWQALIDPSTPGDETVIIRELRVPRTLLGVLAGSALAVSGALMQGHTRNPLGDPGLLGVTAGASFAVVLSIWLLGITTAGGYVWFAFAGALLGSVAVFLIGSAGRGAPSPVSLALAGAAISYLLYALVQAVTIRETTALDAYRFWVVGALAGRDAEVLTQVAPFIVVGLVLAMVNAPALNLLGLGEDVARGLGQRIWLARVVGLGAITLLTGAATAACGPIAFVGLVVPHVARAITGPDHRWLVPYSTLLGVVLLLLADVLGRVLARPGELQVGIVLAVVGAPFFIALIRRRRLVQL